MISEKALRAGYTKNDKQLLFDDLGEFLARKIHGLIEVKKEEVEAVIQYLDKKIKDA
jgi:hypothetical protein